MVSQLSRNFLKIAVLMEFYYLKYSRAVKISINWQSDFSSMQEMHFKING